MMSRFRLSKSDGPLLLIISALVLQLAFFSPLQVLIQNFGEFAVRFQSVFLLFLTLGFLLVVAVWILVRLLDIPVLPAVLTFSAVTVFVESRFLLPLAGHQPFDGKSIDWDALQRLAYSEMGILLLLGFITLLLFRRLQVLATVSLFILLFVTAGFLHAMFLHTDVVMDERRVETMESRYFGGFSQLSAKQNVIHIVLDQVQGAMVEHIINSNRAHFSASLDGFTLFTQAMGQFKGTYPSVLYYMSGEAPLPESDLTIEQPYSRQYIADVMEQGSIVSLLASEGFKSFGFQFHPGIFCKGPYTACTGTHDEVFAGALVNDAERRFFSAVLTVLDVALFQSSPIFLREKIFNDGQWMARNWFQDGVSHSDVLDAFTQKVHVADVSKTYNYFHHAGAHAPILFDQDCHFIGNQEVDRKSQEMQLRCSLKQILHLIEKLKSIGVYDQTMIVINGDHGTPWLPPGYDADIGSLVGEHLVGMASALLLIKPLGKRGELAYSDSPVTIGDIPATIAGELGLAHDFKGEDVFRISPDISRERLYFEYENASRAHNTQVLSNLTRYRVRGNVFDQHDWVLPNTTASEGRLSALRMDAPDFDQLTEGFSHLEQHHVPMRWVDGQHARVILEPPGQGAFTLVLECTVPEFIEDQRMDIRIGSRLIATLDAVALAGWRHVIPLPEELFARERMEIEFSLSRSEQTGNDTRQLSIMFAYIGLEPAG